MPVEQEARGRRSPSRAGQAGLLLALVASLLSCGAPQERFVLRRPQPAPSAVLLRDVAVLDVARGIRAPGRDVLLQEARIAAIAPTGEIEAPAGAQVISAAGATLVPGLIDMHGHVDADSAPSWARGFPDHEANLRSYLYSGVTTLLDPGDGSGAAFERRERLAAGELLGPRVFSAGPLLTCPGGHPIALVEELAPWWIAWYLKRRVAVPVGDEAEISEVVDRLAAQGADVIKVVVDQIPLSAPRMSRETIAAVVERARGHGLRVVAHIGTTQDAIDAAEAGVAAWVHGVYKERIPDEQLPVLAGYGIPMVATIEVFDRYARTGNGPWEATPLERETVPQSLLDSFHPIPEDFELGSLQPWLDQNRAAREARSENVGRLHAAGVTILAGSDTQSGVFPGPGLHRELHNLVRAGLTPAEAIRAATLDAARFLANGSEPDFGAVEVGMRADLLLVDGDPSADLSALERIRQVFQGGVPLERRPLGADPGS